MSLNPKDYINLNDYVFRGISANDKKDIEECVIEYATKINKPIQDEVNVICEQFNILKARGLPAKDWIVGIINEVSKKAGQKQTIAYIIGMLRNRMQYGWGTTRSLEEQLLLEKVESMIGETSLDTKTQLYEMMGVYGGIRMAFALTNIKLEQIFIQALKEELESQKPTEKEMA